MFGRRPDGRALGSAVDALTHVTPHLMVERSEAMCFTNQCVDADTLDAYVRSLHKRGRRVSKMAVIIAAYVRMVSQMPEINRFVVGRKLYARNNISVSFTMLKAAGVKNFQETTIRMEFDPKDTVFDVADKLNAAIDENRKQTAENSTDKLINLLVGTPGLLRCFAGLVKGLDKLGMLPMSLLNLMPFHSSLYLTNLASIRMNPVYHHLYNFGTVSQFLALGRRETRVEVQRDGSFAARQVYPLRITVDERACGGALYAMGFAIFEKHMKDPASLETPPETVRYERGLEFGKK